jgi:serpin B
MDVMARIRLVACAVLACAALGGCGTLRGAATGGEVRAAVARQAPAVPISDGAAVRDGDSVFAGRLLRALATGTSANVVVSPFSISEALAMTLAGARGQTEQQISATLRFELSGSRLHAALDALDRSLAAIPGLRIADALYGQKSYPFRSAFLDLLGRYYGARMHTVDFERAADQARGEINRWVSEHTRGKIPELLPAGALDALTRLVLVNAVYLKASWQLPFDSLQTFGAEFYAPGGAVTVPTMHETGSLGYRRGHGYQAIELPYSGGRLVFDILLPDPGRLDELERRIAAAGPIPLLPVHAERMVLALPKLTLRTQTSLKTALSALGMPLAFDSARADLSGIAGRPHDVYLKDVVHEAYVRVDERGTEAGAATAAVVATMSLELPPRLRVDVDRPFVFILRDRRTGAILFEGLVTRPLG